MASIQFEICTGMVWYESLPQLFRNVSQTFEGLKSKMFRPFNNY